MWTPAPIGRMSTAATRSLEIALDGVTPKSRISIGVISAPPPAPVMPTSRPMTAEPRTMYGIDVHGERAASLGASGSSRSLESAFV